MARLQCGLERDPHVVGDLACQRAFLGRQRSQPAKHRRQRSLLAEVGDAHGVKRREVSRRGYLCEAVDLLLLQFFGDAHGLFVPSPAFVAGKTKREPPLSGGATHPKDGSDSRGTTLVGPHAADPLVAPAPT